MGGGGGGGPPDLGPETYMYMYMYISILKCRCGTSEGEEHYKASRLRGARKCGYFSRESHLARKTLPTPT